MPTLKADCSLAFLSWRAPLTLRQTLEAFFGRVNVSDFSDAYVYFQEISIEDRQMAEDFSLRVFGNDRNLGIREGIKQAVLSASTPYVLFLENDCRLLKGIDRRDFLFQLERGLRDMEKFQLHVMRFRHRFHPGADYGGIQKFLEYWPQEPASDSSVLKMKRILRREKAVRLAGQSVYVDEFPEQRFADSCDWISRLPSGNLRVSSGVMPWTNQSILIDREKFLNELMPYAEAHPTSRSVNGFPDLEKELNCRWWRKSKFSVGVSDPGLFGHVRLDRSQDDEKLV